MGRSRGISSPSNLRWNRRGQPLRRPLRGAGIDGDAGKESGNLLLESAEVAGCQEQAWSAFGAPIQIDCGFQIVDHFPRRINESNIDLQRMGCSAKNGQQEWIVR